MSIKKLAQGELKELIYAECRALEITARKLADASISGAYRSLKKGSGIEFEEARLYTPTDDARRIDWKVTARKQKPYIKSFKEEQDQSVLIVVDQTPSTLLGIESSKAKKILEISAFIGTIANFSNDPIGSILFDNNGFSYNKPKKGFSNVFQILNEIYSSIHCVANNDSKLEKKQFTNESDNFSQILVSVGKLAKRKSQIFIISDFNFPINFESALKFVGIKHDLFCLSIEDALEESIPDSGTFLLKNPETGEEQLINFSSKLTREAIHKGIESHRKKLNDTFKKYKIPFLKLSTTSDIRSKLFSFFKENSKAHGRS
jgi:uncharacterized protein (DUF58 family)